MRRCGRASLRTATAAALLIAASVLAACHDAAHDEEPRPQLTRADSIRLGLLTATISITADSAWADTVDYVPTTRSFPIKQ